VIDHFQYVLRMMRRHDLYDLDVPVNVFIGF